MPTDPDTGHGGGRRLRRGDHRRNVDFGEFFGARKRPGRDSQNHPNAVAFHIPANHRNTPVSFPFLDRRREYAQPPGVEALATRRAYGESTDGDLMTRRIVAGYFR
jgi:hypothetical protein